MEEIVWGIDPGSSICGIVRLNSGLIGDCFECDPRKVYSEILRLSEGSQFIVVIEDIFPYTLRLTPAVIDTCKLIGELTYRFNTSKHVKSVHLIARNSVKKWIFDTCPDTVIPRIRKKMDALHTRRISKGGVGLIKKDGEMRQPSFHYVDDRTVIAALKSIYNIPTPKPGKPNIFGLKEHSWQALAVGTYFTRTGISANETK